MIARCTVFTICKSYVLIVNIPVTNRTLDILYMVENRTLLYCRMGVALDGFRDHKCMDQVYKSGHVLTARF